MAKRQRMKHPANPGAQGLKPQVSAPDYYWKFHCIGPDCEDSCCVGWRVDLDRKTWQRYQALQSAQLAPVIQKHVALEPDLKRRNDRTYAYVGMLPDGSCPFLQTDRLCMIQNEQGCSALSETCAAFPRHYNQFAGNLEYGLDVSCPEAARLILLSETPIKMIATPQGSPVDTSDADLSSRGFMTYRTSPANPEHNEVRYAFRELILRILQKSEVSLGGRVLFLGLLLDQVNQAVKKPGYRSSAEILPVFAAFETYLADPAFMETQFDQVRGNAMRKLQVATGFLIEFMSNAKPRFGECILACVAGLLGSQGGPDALQSQYSEAYRNHYLPYFRDHGHILENYLVNDVLINLFPFARGDYVTQYQTLVFNLTMIQTILVGMAGHYQGLNDERVVQLIQSYSRMTAHNETFIGKFQQALGCKDAATTEEVAWMLKD